MEDEKRIENFAQFKAQVTNFTLEELEQMKTKLSRELARMIFSGELIEKIAFVDKLIEERKETK